MYVQVSMHVYLYVCMCVFICMHMSVDMYAFIHTCTPYRTLNGLPIALHDHVVMVSILPNLPRKSCWLAIEDHWVIGRPRKIEQIFVVDVD